MKIRRNLIMVIVEGSAIVVRKKAIFENYKGGMAQFLFDIPDDNTLCQDDYLMSFSFKEYHQAKSHYLYIAKQGLKITDFMPDISYADAILCDQIYGTSNYQSWVSFRFEKIDQNNKVRIAQFYDEDTDYNDTEKMTMAKIGVPKNWEYEKSMTQMLQYHRMNIYKSFLNH